MENKLLKCCMILVLWVCFFTGSLSAANFLSDGIFGSESATGRSLLQEKKLYKLQICYDLLVNCIGTHPHSKSTQLDVLAEQLRSVLGMNLVDKYIICVFRSNRHDIQPYPVDNEACPVTFEFLNYTIITSKCKGPQYPAKLCCSAFLEFACPYADQLNDLTNNCASTMFSYINLYGKYPPGLFANECKGDKQGLICEAPPPSVVANDKSSQIMRNPSSVLMFALAFLVLILQLS